MKLEIESKILVGAETKAFLVDLTKQIDRLEKLAKMAVTTTGPMIANDAEDEDEEDEAPAPKAKKAAAPVADDEDEEDEAPAPKAKKKAAPVADDEDEEDETPAPKKKAAPVADDEDEDEAPAPKKKAKKISVEEVNDACKTRAQATGGKAGRAEVLAILKKKFKVESVSDLEPEQYSAVIAAMEA